MTNLLAAHEPRPVTVEREVGRSGLFLSCDHAGKRIPTALGSLGLSTEDRQRHIAWDIGAAGVSRYLANELDATLVMQNYSRLVIDCNRPHDNEQLIPRHSEATEIPGNRALSDAQREQRRNEIYRPYHEMISRLLDRRLRTGQATAFVAIHSFTPIYLGKQRPWHIGILYDRDRRMAGHMLEQLSIDQSVCIGDNEPYRIDQKDYGIPVHGEERGLAHVLIEIRQDLITSDNGQQVWARRLAPLLSAAFSALVLE